jgi:hypothetical protein
MRACSFYLWGMLKEEAYSNTACFGDGLKESIQDAVSLLSAAEL